MIELTYDEVIDIHYALVSYFENDEDSISPPGVKNPDLLHSAISRPFTSMGSGDDIVFKYEKASDKAASLLHSLIKNHAFHNGNKRTALVSAIRFLDVNKYGIVSSEKEYFDLIINIAKSKYPNTIIRSSDDEVDYISKWFNDRIQKHDNTLHNTKLSEFIEKCQELGVHCRESKDKKYFILSHQRRSLKISQNNRTLQGAVQRNYLKKLGLSRGRTGMRFAEFQNGNASDADIIHRLLMVLRQLAAYDREEDAGSY